MGAENAQEMVDVQTTLARTTTSLITTPYNSLPIRHPSRVQHKPTVPRKRRLIWMDPAAGNHAADAILSEDGVISADAYLSGGKWGPSGAVGTSGGTVTWSITGAGLTYQPGNYSTFPFFTGSSVTLSNFLPADYVTQISNAFAAWSAVSNINFVQVADGGGNFGVGTTANIRIGGGIYRWRRQCRGQRLLRAG